MRVAVFLNNKISKEEGGAFSYTEKLIHALDSYHFDKPTEIVFVGRIAPENVGLKRHYYKLAPRFFFRIFYFLEEVKLFWFIKKVFRFDLNFVNNYDLKILRKNKIDVVFFINQGYRQIFHFPFITMNWDIGHKSTFAFPEFVLNGAIETRLKWYGEELQQALAVFVESNSGKEELVHYCRLAEEKVFIIPMFPGKVVELNVAPDVQQSSLRKLGVEAANYFYYPAQFWAHKNHYNLLLAFKEVLKRHPLVKLVFSGSDQGNKNFVRQAIKDLAMDKSVILLGFVSNEEVYTLFKNARALVMPTFLGPTNMPLLEAQMLHVPVICSDLKGHREMCGDSAVYFDPTDPSLIATALMELMDNSRYEQMVSAARDCSSKTIFTIANALNQLNLAFSRILSVRRTFK